MKKNQRQLRLFGILYIALMMQNSFAQEQVFYWEGHRGCRGLLPENTISAFCKALDLGMNTPWKLIEYRMILLCFGIILK